VRFVGELDRIYPDSPANTTLSEPTGALRIHAEGFRDTIVWNPGERLGASIPDLGEGEHRHFVCVEAGTVIEPITLAPGQAWRGSQQLQEAD
jgi:glucose-6-phosphate 1-epimerase